MSQIMLTCSKCKVPQDVSRFHKNTKHKTGHASYCKSCASEYQQKDCIKEKRILAKQTPEYQDKARLLEIKYKSREPVKDVMFVCGDCEKSLPETDFHRKSYSKNGYASRCKKCNLISKHTPEYVEWIRNHRLKPHVKAKHRAEQKTPEYLKNKRAYNQLPHRKIKNSDYRKLPRTVMMAAKIRYKERGDSPVLYRAKRMRLGMTARAKQYGFPLDHEYFTVQRLIDMQHESDICPCCSDPFDFSISKNTIKSSPSVDKIIPGLGYVPGNVKLICYECNNIKSNGTAQRHMQIADYMTKYCKDITV